MSTRILVLNRLIEIARELEATEAYAVLAQPGGYDWGDSIDVLREQKIEKTGRGGMAIFAQLSTQAKSSGSAFELTPSPPEHCLIVPVPVGHTRAALGCFFVRGDDRTAYFMLKLAKLLLQRADYFAQPDAD